MDDALKKRDGARREDEALQDLTPLEELEQLRGEFLAMVGYYLRAPLASIKGATATVLGASSSVSPAEMTQFFRLIDDQANYMSGLIRNLMVAGRIDTGALTVTPEPVDLAGLVDRARNTFLTTAGRHEIFIDLSSDLPRVMADRQYMFQVLDHLLSNAARNSPESVPIRVSAARDGVHVAVSVSNEGRGMPAEQLARVFQKYTGVDGQGERGSEEAGPELRICRGLVEAHGGRIWAVSGGTGLGTRFTFTIPVAEEAAAGAALSFGRRYREGREPIPVLVVDDDPHTLRYVGDALASAGFSPLVTADHREIPRIVNTEKPRLVLLDLLLPGTDGIELMGSVPELADLPVIFISGYGKDETIARALAAGAVDYIVKPFCPAELTARIRAALRRRAEPEPFVLGDLAIHYDERRVTVAGRPVRLTATEYDLLRVLSVNAGRVSTYGSLIRHLWGGPDSGNPDLVRSFVRNLRRKLSDSARQPAYIFNARGVGYRMAKPGGS